MEHEGRTRGPGSDGADALDVATSPGRVDIRLVGEVDVTVATAFRHRLRALLVDGFTEVVVDLRDVTFMDSSGLGALVGGQRQVRVYRGSFALRSPSPAVRRLLSLTALDRVFEVDEDGDAG